MGDERMTEKPQLTSFAADDLLTGVDASQVNDRDKNVTITFADLMGATTPANVCPSFTDPDGCQVSIRRETPIETIARFRAGLAFSFVGTQTTHKFEIRSDDSVGIEIDGTTQDITMPQPYSNDIGGGTIRPLYITDTGLLGYDSSTVKNKTVHGEMGIDEAKWILEMPVIFFENKKHPGKKIPGFLAEDLAAGDTNGDTVVFYDTLVKEDGEFRRAKANKYENWPEISAAAGKKPKKVTAKKYDGEKKGERVTVDEEIEIVKTVSGIDHVRLIPYMLTVMKNQEEKIERLEAGLDELSKKIKGLGG